MASKSERMKEVETQMSDKRDWRIAEFDRAITRCEELLRSPDLLPEHRQVIESQLANFRHMREEL